jgi:crossover junction endodeoxyribonuclease RusA
MFKIVFVFDSLPPSDLSPNARLHWRGRAARVKVEREYARLLGIQNKGTWEAPERAIISFEFHSSTKKVFDLDNAISACKSWVDGLRDAGILLKDDCWHLSYGSARVVLAKHDETRLILEACE